LNTGKNILNVNLITERTNWAIDGIGKRIIQYNANPLVKYLYNENISGIPVFYLDMHRFIEKDVLDVVFFTQPYWDSWETINRNVLRADHIIHMVQLYYDMFLEHGVPASKMTHLIVPIDKSQFKLKKVCFGFSGKPADYKGLELLEYALSKYSFPASRFKWIGKLLEPIHQLCIRRGIESKYIESPGYEDYPREYSEIDYMIVPDTAAGGPLPVLESYSMGIPVIASRMGMVLEIGADYIFERGNPESLLEVLKGIEEERLNRRERLAGVNCEIFSNQVSEIFLKLAKEKGLIGQD